MSEKNKDKVAEITAQLQKGIEELFESDRYKEYLRVMGRFSNYSFGNCLLIALQRPDATNVAGFRAWQKKFNRNVKAGATGIKILAPVTYKRKFEETVTDEQGKPILDKSGKELKREVEKELVGYRVEYVYAYEDTEGQAIPEIVEQLNDDVKNFDELLEILERISPVPVLRKEIESKANGYYDLVERKIYIDSRLPQLQMVKTTLHEIAHVFLHDKFVGGDKEANQNEREISAESVAYTVCSFLGLSTEDYSFGYIAGWSKQREPKEMQEKMEVIRKTSNMIIKKIEAEILSRKLERVTEVAYKGEDGYLLIEKAEKGYRYELINPAYEKVSESAFGDPNLTMKETIAQVLEIINANREKMYLCNVKELREKVIATAIEIEDTEQKYKKINRRSR